MAATPKTMAEVLASSMPPLNNKNSGNEDGKTIAESKEENDVTSSGNTMVKTYPFLTITVYIPTACVGVLIGKRGSNIDSIQKLAAKESTKSQNLPRGPRNNNKSSKQNNKGNSNNNKSSNGTTNIHSKPVSPDSVRISVVNYPPPPSNDQHLKYIHNPGKESENALSSSVPQQQQQQQHHQQQQPLGGASGAMMDMGVPPTYTELDFSDPQWTPIVIRADPIAAVYAANAIQDICCPEYIVDRNQLVYIIDVPVPAVAATNNANLRHASIVGKRGNKLIQLSADHKCRIMVPPKQLGHDVIQLEAPLKECCSCLKAITGKLQAGGSDEQMGDATTKASPSSPNAKNAKNNAKGKNNFQTTLVIQPLPSQTKLRNIARKTETKILKKKIPKPQQNNGQKQSPPPPPPKPEQESESKEQQLQQHPEQSLEEGETGEEPQEKQDGDGANNNTNNTETKISWRLTVIASTEKKVLKAVDMLKVLNSKGYEILEESGVTNNTVDTSNKSLPEGALGGTESDADNVVEDVTPKPTTNGHGGRGGGRGGRHKKQRHRNNHRGNNGKDNNGGKQQVPTAPPTTAVGES